VISPTTPIFPMDGREQTKRSVWLDILTGLTMAIGVIVVWWSISDRAHKHVQQMADNAARVNQSLIRQDIGHRILALERLGRVARSFWPNPSKETHLQQSSLLKQI